MTIRRGRFTDMDTLVDLGVQFLADSPHGTGATDRERVANVVYAVLVAGICMVAEDRGGAVVAMLGYLVGPHPIGGIVTAMEVGWFVHPDHRGGAIARLLVEHGEEAAREAGAKRIQIGAPDVRVGIFLNRLGYKQIEVTYGKELP